MSITLTTNITINAENNSNLEKVYCSATLDDDFSANEVLIVLNKETSKQLNTNISFDNIDYLQIEDLTSSYDSEEEINYDMGIVVPFSLNQMVTSNGSYILPSGIVVLVDEDIEAYFNGTLVVNQNGTIIS